MEIKRFESRPQALLCDTAPRVFKSQDGRIFIRGDSNFTYVHTYMMWALVLLVGLGLPLLFNVSFTVTEHRVMLVPWFLVVFYLPLFLKDRFSSLFRMNISSKTLWMKFGLWNPKTVSFPWEDIIEVRRDKFYYMTVGGGRTPAQRIDFDLAYINLKSGEYAGIPFLAVDTATMDQFIDLCTHHQIKLAE